MEYVECPNTAARSAATSPSIFLAGGITGCPDWQSVLVGHLQATSLIVFNPRRSQFPIDDPSASAGQIEWEYQHLRQADAIAFWFPCESLCPIALYELGAWSMTAKPLAVGVHPSYSRRSDIEIQTALVRPDIQVVYSLADLAGQILDWQRSAN